MSELAVQDSTELRTSGTFQVLLVIFVVNAAVTIVHFTMMFARIIPTRNSIEVVARIAVADIAVAAGPSFVAAWGLWRSRRWGLWLALLACGAYFHGQIELLMMAAQQRLGWSMAAVSLYFIAFSAVFAIYLWRRRERLT